MTESSVANLMQGIGRAARAAAPSAGVCHHRTKESRLARGGGGAARPVRRRFLAANEARYARRHADAARAARCSIACGSTINASRPWPAASRTSRGSPIPSAGGLPTGRARMACRFKRVCVPLGVIGIIYESRPNVTADAGALCLKSGNAVILRGGSESARSSAAIHACLRGGAGSRGPAARPAFNWCPPPIARPSARCWPRWPTASMSSCRAAAKV